MGENCPICSNELTSKTEARRLSSMWSSIIREAEKNDEAIAGVCYPCGELFDLGSFTNDPEAYERISRQVFSSRSLGQKLRRKAESVCKENRVPTWVGMTADDYEREWNFRKTMAKHEARKRFINESIDEQSRKD